MTKSMLNEQSNILHLTTSLEHDRSACQTTHNTLTQWSLKSLMWVS